MMMKESGKFENWAVLAAFTAVVVVFTGIIFSSTVAHAETVVKVYKNASCSCCSRWADHLDSKGFKTDVEAVKNLDEIKRKNGIPAKLASCHTAKVGGYFIEGHVPAGDIHRLLQERPDIAGLTVPGMPMGSPGMEMPGRPADAYKVYAVGKDGSTSVYASH